MVESQRGRSKLKLELPEIPDKLYFSIGDVSKLCAVPPHVLRYWEQEFHQIKPTKRRGNRRYYQRKDVLLIREIRSLLYVKGFTIAGAKQQLGRYYDVMQADTAGQVAPVALADTDQSNLSQDISVLCANAVDKTVLAPIIANVIGALEECLTILSE